MVSTSSARCRIDRTARRSDTQHIHAGERLHDGGKNLICDGTALKTIALHVIHAVTQVCCEILDILGDTSPRRLLMTPIAPATVVRHVDTDSVSHD